MLLLAALPGTIGIQHTLDDWHMQSSESVHGNGSAISTAGYPMDNWLPVRVPCTVMACLIQNGQHPNIFYDTNLKTISTEPFDHSWWYRIEFTIPDENVASTPHLTFQGINYRANVWLNGVQLANSDQIVGTFRYFDFGFDTEEGTIALAVEVFRPHDTLIGNPVYNNSDDGLDLAITFVDWAPKSPDSNMGLFGPVLLDIGDPVSIRYPEVTTTLEQSHDTLNKSFFAQLTVMAEVTNFAKETMKGTLRGSIMLNGESIVEDFHQDLKLIAGQNLQVVFSNADYPQLVVSNPQLWWPWQMGNPIMHTLSLSFESSNNSFSSSVASTWQFGIRSVSSKLDKNKNRIFFINGVGLLIRGGGWAPDLLLRRSSSRLATEFQYIRDLNLNAVRLEGKPESNEFFHLADKNGILTMPGWCCCDAWQNWPKWKDEQYLVAQESLRSQLRRLRIHPSVLVFLYSSDELPPAKVENMFLSVFDEEKWGNEILAAASSQKSPKEGHTGVKMSGPYAWVPPNYWLLEDSHGLDSGDGGAFGFNTETSIGASPFTLESLQRTIPPDKLWPGPNDHWNYHCGADTGNFHSLKWFTPALLARFGEATSADDYLYKSQAMAYEGHRAMMEAYGRNKFRWSTGVVQWMLNSAWPSFIWHLYDYYLNPGGAYFGTKKALELLHLQFSYDDRTIWLVNSMYTSIEALFATATVHDLNGTIVHNFSATIDKIKSDDAMKLSITIPSQKTQETWILTLRLIATGRDVSGANEISHNSYWLPSVDDVINFDRCTWYNCKVKQYADLSSLSKLPSVNLTHTLRFSRENSIDPTNSTALITVTNPSSVIALLVRVRLLVGVGGPDVLPIRYTDNFFTLLPSEQKQITAFYNIVNVGDNDLVVKIDAFNNRKR